MALGNKSEGRDLRLRLILVGGFFLAGLTVLMVNLYRLMVIRYDEYYSLSQDNQFKDVRVRAPRGEIRDRRGEVLVDSRPSFDVFVTPAFCQKCLAEVLPRIADYLQWDEPTRERIFTQVRLAHGPQRYQPMAVGVDLTRDQLDVMQAHLREFPGVDVEPVPHRNYRTGPVMAHVLGYMNEVTQEELTRLNGASEMERPPYALGDYIGRRGVERSFESDLRGQDGWRKEVVNARGELWRDEQGNAQRVDVTQPVVGNNVVLSIDARLQAEGERLFPGLAGAVVVVEAKTGFLLSVVSRPSFDSNQLTGRVSPSQMAAFARDPLQPMVFRAAAEHYHPGSTFKPITLLAALRSGSFTPHSATNCPGGYRLGARTWRCDLERGHGPLAGKEALQKSCDVYFYRVADVLGVNPIAEVAREFGLGKPTQLGVAAEVPGVVPDEAYHDKYTPGGYQKGMALNTSIGQGDVNVTPLQLAMMYAALGNGGTLYRPQVVRRIESPDGKMLKQFQPDKVRTIEMTEEQRQVLYEGLLAVVNEPGGTAYGRRLKDVLVAGKTGTAQVARLGAVRLKKDQIDYLLRDHSWFAAFAPANDPEIAVVVLNEHGGFGASGAAPTAMAMISKYFELKRGDSTAFGDGWHPAEPVKAKPPPPAPLMAPTTPPVDKATPQLAAPLLDAGPLPLAGELQPPPDSLPDAPTAPAEPPPALDPMPPLNPPKENR